MIGEVTNQMCANQMCANQMCANQMCTNHVWQSTVFAVAAGLLTLAFRRNRAGVRYWIWFAAPIAAPAVSFTMSQIAQPFSGAATAPSAVRATRDWWEMAIPAVWFCGVAFFAALRFRGWLRVRAAVRASMVFDLAAPVEVRCSPGLLEPGVVGLWRPVLLAPEGIADRAVRHGAAIVAVCADLYSDDLMMGPTLQALLEERFHLRIHRETRETPVYALRVAEGGLKLPRFPEGSCVPIDFTQFRDAIERVRRNGQAFEPTFPAGTKYCPNLGSSRGPLNVVEAQGTSIREFFRIFLRELDRPVIDQTGLAGLFNFHLEYAPAAISPALEEQLGLRLVATGAPRDFLVIDRIEMPAGN